MTEVKVNNSSERPPEEFILKLEADCERHIGHDKYCFFVPLEIGSFVVYCWTKEKLPSNKLKRKSFSLEIFFLDFRARVFALALKIEPLNLNF
jgi:hypothetical protein